MLYTFSKADYPNAELQHYLTALTEQDVVVLWQNGVFLALKYAQQWQICQAKCYVLAEDVFARNISEYIPQDLNVISLMELVKLTEQYFPQFAL